MVSPKCTTSSLPVRKGPMTFLQNLHRYLGEKDLFILQAVLEDREQLSTRGRISEPDSPSDANIHHHYCTPSSRTSIYVRGAEAEKEFLAVPAIKGHFSPTYRNGWHSFSFRSRMSFQVQAVRRLSVSVHSEALKLVAACFLAFQSG